MSAMPLEDLTPEQAAKLAEFEAAPGPVEIKLARYDQRRQAAWQEVVRLCGGGRWTMRVPVDEERDSDTIITAALDDGEAATEALRRVVALADFHAECCEYVKVRDLRNAVEGPSC